MFATLGVPPDCYDAIVTSGAAAREDLAPRAPAAAALAMLHLGPERDRGVYRGPERLSGRRGQGAEIVLCTGLYDDDTETPDDYRDLLEDLQAQRA